MTLLPNGNLQIHALHTILKDNIQSTAKGFFT